TAPGATPWLPLGDAAGRNVAGQRADAGSVLAFCRGLLALRRAELGGRLAGYELIIAESGLWAYRTGDLVVAVNLADEPAGLPGAAGEVLIATDGAPGIAGRVLGAWEGVVARAG
ncbi:MAG TPA: DUF3459 domain-containing protein, partial [Streptosporangiaceae bacterium]|nr:DUF3459 domain-containing protein [Streptosporangiaceae bacterium]